MTLWNKLLDLLYPPKCPFCSRLLREGEEHLCDRCDLSLPWMEEEDGKPVGEFLSDSISALWYRDAVRASHHRFKFRGMRSYAKAYGAILAQSVRGQLEGGVDVVCWAPVSKKRRRSRGYDQGELLARELAARLELPVEPLLDKLRHNKAQATIREEGARRANVMGAYALHPGAQVKERRILLVDDVATTGSTLSECARVLCSVGARSVVSVTLAVTPKAK